LANQNLSSEESHLLSLSNKYSQSYIFHLLGDFYYQQKNFSKSKDYYLKAISICDEKNEEIILQDKINDILGIGN
jgi:predicted negative regulator of RcsB-dependent stress response